MKQFHYKTRQERRNNWNMIEYRVRLRQAMTEYRCRQSLDPNTHDELTQKISELYDKTPLPTENTSQQYMLQQIV